MEESCYMTRTLPTKMRLPNNSTTSVSAENQLGPTSTLPAPWASMSSYQKHGQAQHQQHLPQQQHHQQQQLQQQQQQQYQHAVHHSKGYRQLNGVTTNSAAKMSTENHSHPFPPPRPFSQTLPHNKYHYSHVQNPAPAYHHHHQSYQPPSAVYAPQAKVASVQPTHLYNRSYASPLRSSPPPQASMATIKQVQMVTGSVKNGNKTPSPPAGVRQSMYSATNDVTLRRTNGVSSSVSPSTTSRRNAVYLQQSANVAKAANAGQVYYQQPSNKSQQQQHQAPSSGNDSGRNYSSKSLEPTHRSTIAGPHRSLSPQDIVICYEDPPSRNSPGPQAAANGGGSGKCAKPPLPPALAADGLCPAASGSGPRPPPRTRPKSWTSSLFNAMRNNHSSVTFQCVLEEQAGTGSAANVAALQPDQPRPKDASELAMPLTAASASDGQKFYSLPRPGNESGQNKVSAAKTRSRTPSPFRTIIKGLVKGELVFSSLVQRLTIWFSVDR